MHPLMLQNMVAEIQAYVRVEYGHDACGCCLYHAVLAKLNLGAKIVAGSATWQFSADYGSNPTHFTYLYEKGSEVTPELTLPEMHVWNEIDGEVLDLSTAYLPMQCARLMGYRWERDFVMPPYFQGPPFDPSGKRWAYKAEKEATELALHCAANVFGPLDWRDG